MRLDRSSNLPRTQRVAAFVLVFVGLLVTASTASAISISIRRPGAGQLVGDQLFVVATVQSELQLASVSAAVEDRTAPLAYHVDPGWSGTVSLSGLVSGRKTLTVTATDVFGGSAQATQSFVLDRPPLVTVMEPRDLTVARPDVHVTATCTDDDSQGCVSLTVSVPTTKWTSVVVASGTSAVDQTISLSRWDRRPVTLQIQGRDSAGQQTSARNLTIYVDSSERLTDVASVEGAILDVTADRILFMDGSNDPPLKIRSLVAVPGIEGPVLKIHSRVTGQDVAVPSIGGKTPQYGFLTAVGAIFVAGGETSHTEGIYDWRGSGSPIALGFPNSASSLAVSGNYAIWTGEPGDRYTGTVILFQRDLVSGTNIEILDGVGNIFNDLSANGDVVFWAGASSTDYNIFRYRDGIVTRLTNDTQLWNTYPVTDGINVVYLKSTPCCLDQAYAIAMYGASGELTLTSPRSQEPQPGTDYAASNGWIAFTQSDIATNQQVWVRSPDGINKQVSFFGSSSRIDALTAEGEVMFLNGNQRYLGNQKLATGVRRSLPIAVSSRLGWSFSQERQWESGRPLRRGEPIGPVQDPVGFVVIGRSLFRVSVPLTEIDQ